MINPASKKLFKMFELMLDHFGPQRWWPGESELEMMVGAILTQNTNWNNVEKAIENLKIKNLLSIEALYRVPADVLAESIRPAGYFNIKAGRLKNLITFIMKTYKGEIAWLFSEDMEKLKQGFLSVKGIGPETADSIMLYAFKYPVFVIDTYTHRIITRHGLADEQSTYYDLQELFMNNLPEDEKLFNEFHALIVKTGKEYCRKNPHCDICPLEKLK